MMVDVFVSYASQDRDRVLPIVTALTEVGWTVWWDRAIGAGTAFDREIEKAIDQARCVVVVWTGNSIESEWVRTEANEGLDKNILVPVQLEDVKLPLAFRRIQTIDLSAASGYSGLIDSIASLVPVPVGTDSDLTPFVGREKELTLLESRLASAERGEGEFLLLSGDAGVGKSRLAHELSKLARNRNFMVLDGHSLDMEGAPPYQPLIEQIEQAARIVPRDVMRQTLGDNAPEVSKLMPELRQVFDDIPEPVPLPPEQERRYLLHGVSEFISRAAEASPMLLIFEDVHWADSSTCVLLRYLADRIGQTNVLMIATYREAELDTSRPFSRTLQELNRERLVEDIHLDCLDRALVEKLLENKAGSPPPKALTELVFSETEGNPFFIEELYRHLLESGKMFNEAGEFASDIEIADTEVPRGVRLIIGERLEKISDDCRTALTIGSVIGRQFNFEVLLSASNKLDEDDLLDAMDEAMAEKLVVDQSRDREAIYGFAQEQVRQTLLSGLSFPRRQRMHLRIADALESYAGDNTDRFVPEIAHHLYQAGAAADEEKTVSYLKRAAERAVSALAYEDALLLYDSLLSILDESNRETVAEVDALRAKALQGLERTDEALDVLREAVDLLPAGELKDDLILQRCKVLLDVWRGSQAVDDLEQLLERRRQGSDRDKELETQLWVARALYVVSLDQQGFAERAITAYEDTIDLARELNRPAELGQALVASTQLADYAPSYIAKARDHLQEAEQIAADIGSEDLEIEVATARLNIYLSRDENEIGEAVLEKLEKRRDPIRLNAHYFRMMWSTYGAGKLHRCIEICDAGTDLAYRIGTLPVQYPTIKGLAFMDLGRFEEAWQALDEEIADEEHRFGTALQDFGRMQYELNVGAFDAALARAPHVIEEAHALSRVWMLRWTANLMALAMAVPGNEGNLTRVRELIETTGYDADSSGRAAIALAEGNSNTAEELLEKRLKSDSRYLELRGRLMTTGLLTSVYERTGQWEALRDSAKEIINTAEQCDMNPLCWRQLVALSRAEAALGDSENSKAHQEKAEALWQQTMETIPEASHRDAYTHLAEKLGL
jgi:tetratricopeptide (TPR) repeat protein